VTNILPNLGNQEEKVSLSERFKSTAMKLKEKFSPSKISNFVGLNSNGKRENTLERILSFMKKSHERKMQMYGVERLFQEELLNEDQRRHNEFVKVLKNYVSGETGGATLVVASENNEDGMIKKITRLIMATVNKTINALVGGIRLIVEGMIGSALGALKGLVALLPLVGSISSIMSLVGMINKISKLVGLFGIVLRSPLILTFGALSAAIFYAYKEYSKYGEEIAGRIEYFSNKAIAIEKDEDRMKFIDELPKDIKSGVQVNVIKAFMKPKEARDILDSKNEKEIERYGYNFLFNRAFQDLENTPEYLRLQEEINKQNEQIKKAEIEQVKAEKERLKPNVTPLPPRETSNDLIKDGVLNSPLDAPRTQKDRSIKPMLPSTASPDREILGSDLPSAERIVFNPPSVLGINLIDQDIPSSSTTSLTVENLGNFIPKQIIQNNSLKTDAEKVQPIINNSVNNNSRDIIPSTTATVTDNTPIIDHVFRGSATQF
jgi:hypothetical protein